MAATLVGASNIGEGNVFKQLHVLRHYDNKSLRDHLCAHIAVSYLRHFFLYFIYFFHEFHIQIDNFVYKKVQ